MAKNDKSGQQGGAASVTEIQRCPVDACSKKADRAGFCNEHFSWFKEGLINKKGEKPKDFDKKYQAFIHRKPAA
jgi:hypothetical protein